MTERPLPPPARARVLLPFAGCTLIWGSTWLAIRYELGIVAPEWSIVYRFAIGGLLMFALALAMRHALAMTRRGHLLALGIGIMQFVLNYQFVYASEARIASGLVAVVSALMLVSNAALGRIVLGEQVSRPFVLGSGVALGGIALLFAHELARDGADAWQTVLGITLATIGFLSASVANVLQGTAPSRQVPAPTLLAWSMLYGTVANVAVALAIAGGPTFDLRAGYVLALLYLALFGSAVAFTLYLGVIRAIGPARAAYSSVLTPVIAMALSTLFEGYRWSVMAAAGAALTLVGLAVALRARSPAR